MAIINKEFICVSEEAVPPLDFTGSPIYMQRLVLGAGQLSDVWYLSVADAPKLAGDMELRHKLLVNGSEPCFYLQTWNNIPYSCLRWVVMDVLGTKMLFLHQNW